ncbi:RecX family transcriptional regulator [Anaerolineales bacterium]
MRRITALEIQKKDHERVNVYLDGEFAFGLNIMDATRLSKGQELSEEDIAALCADDDAVRAMNHGIVLLSYRPRSISEIRQNLAKKKYSEESIEKALSKLESMGYVDDKAFARFWVENRNQFKPHGAQALRYELRQKGIDDTAIEEVLEEMLDEEELAYQAAQKRITRMKGKTRQEFKQKIGSFLQRRGFNYSHINSALIRYIDELSETDPDFFTEADEGNRTLI